MTTFVLIPIFLLIGLSLSLLIFCIISVIRKKRIKKQWEKDQQEFSENGTISVTRNHTGDAAQIVLIVLICVVAFLTFTLLFRWLIADLHDQIVLSERNIRSYENELYHTYTEELNQIRRELSHIADFRVEAVDGPDANTQNVTFKVITVPKEYNESTTVSLKIGDTICPAEKNGNCFSALYTANMFEGLLESEKIHVLITTDGITYAEMLEEKLFSDAQLLLYASYDRFIPWFSGYFGPSPSHVDVKNKTLDCEYEFHGFQIAIPQYGNVTMTSCVIGLEIDGDVVKQSDVTDKFLANRMDYNGDKACWALNDFIFNYSGPFEPGQTAFMTVQLTDSQGRTVKEYLTSLTDDGCPVNRIVTDAQGNVLIQY